MYSNDTIRVDRLEVANNILIRLEMEYKYAVNKNVDKPEMVKFLAQQLERLSDKAVLGWNEALNRIADTNPKHPPSIPEIIEEMRKIEIKVTPLPKLESPNKAPLAAFWDKSNDDEKETFFDRYHRDTVSPATKWIAREHYRGKGWSEAKISKTLGKPF